MTIERLLAVKCALCGVLVLVGFMFCGCQRTPELVGGTPEEQAYDLLLQKGKWADIVEMNTRYSDMRCVGQRDFRADDERHLLAAWYGQYGASCSFRCDGCHAQREAQQPRLETFDRSCHHHRRKRPCQEIPAHRRAAQRLPSLDQKAETFGRTSRADCQLPIL